MRHFKVWKEGCKVEKDTTYFTLNEIEGFVSLDIVDPKSGERVPSGSVAVLESETGRLIKPFLINCNYGLALDRDGCVVTY
jgi:hypothetical protein